MIEEYNFKNLSEIKERDLFTVDLKKSNTIYYQFLSFDGNYYTAQKFQSAEIMKWQEDIRVIIIGRVPSQRCNGSN